MMDISVAAWHSAPRSEDSPPGTSLGHAQPPPFKFGVRAI